MRKTDVSNLVQVLPREDRQGAGREQRPGLRIVLSEDSVTVEAEADNFVRVKGEHTMWYLAALGLLGAWMAEYYTDWEEQYWMEECYAGNVTAEQCRQKFGWN